MAIEVAMVVTEAAVDKAEEEVATFMAVKIPVVFQSRRHHYAQSIDRQGFEMP